MIEINSYVFHKKYGIGQIKQIESKSIDVYFTIGIKKFPYPNSIDKDLYEVYDKAYVVKKNKLIRYIGKNRDVTIPSAITIIGHRAFDVTDIETVSLDNHVEKIEDRAFLKCKNLVAITDTNNLEVIGNKAFCGCVSLSRIKLPDSLWNIDGGVFSKCFSLKQVILPKNIKSVDYELFEDCSNLVSIFFEGDVKYIENDAFRNCESLNYIYLGKRLLKIGKGSFINCPKLKVISLPRSVRSIHKEAFDETISIQGEKRSYAERYAKKNDIRFIQSDENEDVKSSFGFELPTFIKKQFTSNTDYEDIATVDLDIDSSKLENDENSDTTSVKTLLHRKNKKSSSLSAMTTIEKIVYSALAIVALFYSRDSLSNMVEQIAYGHINTPEGIYTGESFLGSISGEGTMEFSDGRIYSGEWNNGLPNGSGELMLVNGSSFVGDFSKGVFSEGEYIVKDNQNNEIQFNIIDSEPVSYSYIFKDGTTVDKDLLSNNSDYQISFSNGDLYVGKLNNNLRSGDGEYLWKDNTKYEGSWSSDLMTKGTLTYSSGTVLSGSFADNMLYDGTITFAKDNYTFLMKIEKGINNGEYAIINNRNETYQGSIYNKQIKGSGTIEFDNNDKYEGEIVGGKKQGYGEYTWSNGAKYVGYWKDDKMNGYGTYYYGDVQRIEGTFVDGKPNGTCYYYDKDGIAYTSYWNNGEQTSIYKR